MLIVDVVIICRGTHNWVPLDRAIESTKSIANAMMDETSAHTDVAYLLAHMWLKMLRLDVDIQGAGKVAWVFDKPFQKSDVDWQALITSAFELKHGYLILKRWLLSQNVNQDDDIFERGYHHLLEETSLLQGLMEGITTRKALEASVKSIEESKRGIDEAHTVGRLTQLAFIFLPLTFVTGVFGMNITAFAGGAPMWKFWVTLVTVSVPSFIFGLQTARRQLKPKWDESILGSVYQGEWEPIRAETHTLGHMEGSPRTLGTRPVFYSYVDRCDVDLHL